MSDYNPNPQPEYNPQQPYGQAPQPQQDQYQGYQAQQAQGWQQGTQASTTEAKSFFSALFDIKFDTFITNKFASVIYMIMIALTGLQLLVVWLIPAFTAFVSDDVPAFLGVIWLLFGWIVPLFSLVCYRMILEFIVAGVRTAQNTTELLNK